METPLIEAPHPNQILTLPFHPFEWNSLLGLVEDWIDRREKFQVVIANVHSLVTSLDDREFHGAIEGSRLVVSDSMPIVWASRLLGAPLPKRIAGPDFLDQVCSLSQRKGYRHFFLGTTDALLDRLIANLKNSYPSLQVAGSYSPPMRQSFSEEECNEMIQKVNAASPDILWVGMTAPKQEKWIFNHLNRLDCRMAVGIGAAFEFFAGTKKRAPAWVQNLGMEWFHRFCQEPRRLCGRYARSNTIFLFLAFREFLKKRLGKSGS